MTHETTLCIYMYIYMYAHVYIYIMYICSIPCAWLTCVCLWLCCGRSLTWLCVSRKFPLGWSQRRVVHGCIWKVRPQGCDQKCTFQNCILNVKVTLSDMFNPTLSKIRYTWMQTTPGMWFFFVLLTHGSLYLTERWSRWRASTHQQSKTGT